MSLLLLGKQKASALISSRASLRYLVRRIHQKLPVPLHTLQNSTSRQRPCYSTEPVPGSATPGGANSLHMQDLDEKAVELVRQIHSTDRKAVFYVAGGGVQVCFTVFYT